MITNSREYQISKAQRAKLVAARQALPQSDGRRSAQDLERAALQSEIDVLTRQIQHYEDLYEGRLAHLEVAGLEAIPSVLVQARVASQMTQKDLADRLGIHMQQVQRYEASGYRAISFERLLEIAQVLGVRIRQDVVLADPLVRKATVALEEWGLGREFLLSRGVIASRRGAAPELDAVESFNRLRHVFGWSPQELERPTPLRVGSDAIGRAHFKLPAGRRRDFVEAYSAYAYRVAAGAAKCAASLPRANVPSDAGEARRQLLERGPLSLRTIVDWAWGLGIAVVPLQDPAGFNAAFWRFEGRNVIVLKQQTDSVDRVMHDALHEIFHASQEAHLASRSVVDTSDMTAKTSDPEERAANVYASDVLLAGKANALVEEVAQVAKNRGPALKSATMKVAARHGVSAGALANHLAWILQQQERSENRIAWWGTAQNLQNRNERVLSYVNDVAFSRLVPPAESDLDVELLFHALRSESS